ncbi:MAG: PAS domain-containing sensor histidine kinase [Janthinobacterium lividum]
MRKKPSVISPPQALENQKSAGAAENQDAVMPDPSSTISHDSSLGLSFHSPSPSDPSVLELPVLEAAPTVKTSAEQASAALKISERQYRRLFEAARDGILILDSEQGKVTDANPYMTELLGYSHDELLGRELWQIGLLQDKAASQEAFRRLKQESYIRYEDLPLENQRGEQRQVEFVSNVYREDGHMVIQCNIRDITDRRRIAAELAAAAITVADHRRQAAVLEERTRMAREIHDTLAQGFAGIATQLEAAEAALANVPKPVSSGSCLTYQVQLDKVQRRIGKARDLARESLVEARRSVAVLRSSPIDAGLAGPEAIPVSEALSQFLTQHVLGTATKSRYVLEGIPYILPVGAAHYLLRVGQEAIANALAHAHAEEIAVQLFFDTTEVRLHVSDDGRGFDPNAVEAGRFGITGMRERAEQAGGSFVLLSRPGEGTDVELILPTSSVPTSSEPAAEKAYLS